MYEVVKKAIKICFFFKFHITQKQGNTLGHAKHDKLHVSARGPYPTGGTSRPRDYLVQIYWLMNSDRQSCLSSPNSEEKTCRWFVFLVCIQRQTCAFLVLARLQRVFEDNFFLSLSWTEILPASQLVIIHTLNNIYFSCLFFHFKN